MILKYLMVILGSRETLQQLVILKQMERLALILKLLVEVRISGTVEQAVISHHVLQVNGEK